MLLYLEDRQLHHTRGRLHRHFLVFALAEQGGAQRRLVRNLALARLRLGATDDRPGLFFALSVDAHGDFGANSDLVALAILFVDDLGARENALDFADAPLEVRLLILGILVLAALGDVAKLLYRADPLSDLAAAAGRQLFELGLQFRASLTGEIRWLLAHGFRLFTNGP